MLAVAVAVTAVGCGAANTNREVEQNRIVVLDPGHFHAGLLQMHRVEGMCDTVSVYAPEGPELGGYLYNINY